MGSVGFYLRVDCEIFISRRSREDQHAVVSCMCVDGPDPLTVSLKEGTNVQRPETRNGTASPVLTGLGVRGESRRICAMNCLHSSILST